MPPDPNDPVQQALAAAAAQQAGQPKPIPADGVYPSSYSKPVDSLQRKLSGSGLYSHAADIVARMPQAKGTPQQFKAMLLKQGVKPDELKWSGYDEAMTGKKLVTKEELKRHFDTRLPKIQETLHTEGEGADDLIRRENGTAQYGQYTLPGGRNYRELLLQHVRPHSITLPPGYRVVPSTQVPPNHRTRHPYVVMGPAYGGTGEGSFGSGPTPAAAIANASKHGLPEAVENSYASSHWEGTPNVLAHIRMSDRKEPSTKRWTDTDGKQYQTNKSSKILHLEELQSDWAQEGRQQGFRDARLPLTPGEQAEYNKLLMGDFTHNPSVRERLQDLEQKKKDHEQSVPNAPYVDNTSKWVDLALKRVLHEAAKGGYDKIAITPGEKQAKRYDIGNRVDALNYNPEAKALFVKAHGTTDDWQHIDVKPEELSHHIGAELAQKLLATPAQNGVHSLRGVNLHVGGGGMKSFYDKIVPQALEKLARKHDPEARVALHGHSLETPVDSELQKKIRELGLDPAKTNVQQVIDHIGEGHSRNYTIRRHGWSMHDVERVERGEHQQKNPDDVTNLHSLKITPKMRASILKGQPAYAAGGAVGGIPEDLEVPGHGRIKSRPIREIQEAAGRYMQRTGRKPELGGFKPLDEHFARRVARAYQRMKDQPDNPRVRRAYDALISETLDQYKALKDTGIDFSFLKPGEKDPYALSPALGYIDLLKNKRLRVFPTDQGYGSGEDSSRNPMLKRVGKVGDLKDATANDAFRIVHDAYGHMGPGNPFFRAKGEERAYQLHRQMYGPEARRAAATETRGQNSWVNFGPEARRNKGASGANTIYAPQKAGLLPRWAEGDPEGYKQGGAVDPDQPFGEEGYLNEKPQRVQDVVKRGQPLRPLAAPPTREQVRTAKADTRTSGDIVNRRLNVIVPEHTRVAGGEYVPGAPGGGRWADAVVRKTHHMPIDEEDPFSLANEGQREMHLHEPLVDQPGHGFKVKDEELDKLWHSAVQSSSKAAQLAVKKHGAHPTFGAKDWHEAMSLPLRDHLWYELSGEKMAENLPDLTPAEHMRMLDILGATSARAKPDENLERTLGTLSQHLRKAPVDVDLTIPSTVRQALAREGSDTSALPGNKTGHFSDTLALAGGVPTRFPISVNDVWVGKMFGVPDDVMSSNQSLHEPMALYFNKLRDLYNERHGKELPFKYQSWNFQAPAWVHLRSKENGAQQGDAYHQVWGKTVDKLRDAGVPGVEGDKITREALMHPGFADALRRTTKPYRDAPKATVEFGTTQSKSGKQAKELYGRALEQGDEKSQEEYLGALTSAMYGSARGKGHPWDRLKKAVTGDVTGGSDITRIASPTKESPLDTGGTFEGAVSPNIRVPLKDMDDEQLEMFNAIAGRHLKQDAMAVSHIVGAEHGSEPRKDHIRGHSVFVPTTERIHPDDIRAFAQDLAPHGHNMSFHRHPNGYQFDILPAFGDNGPVGVSEDMVDEAYGRTLHPHYGEGHIVPHDFKSVYTEAGDYAKHRTKLTNRIRDDYLDQAAEDGLSRADALAALKTPQANLPAGSKKARDVYRARIDHLAQAEQGFKDVARKVEDAHKSFVPRAKARLERLAKKPNDTPPFARGGRVEPTEAQKEAGNYAKRHVTFQGLPISIETAKGEMRRGKDGRGRPWSVRMPADYGYFKKTEGADGDHVDCYIGPHKDSPVAFIVNQHDHRTEKFDEHKVILGTRSEREARDLYCAGFSDGHGAARLGSLEPVSIDGLKDWLRRGKRAKPARTSSIVDAALGIAARAAA